jgi:hypothetical protein
MDKATAPLDLLRELRRGFEHDAKVCREKEKLALSEFEKRAIGARAYANENAVRRIDATLRDWA